MMTNKASDGHGDTPEKGHPKGILPDGQPDPEGWLAGHRQAFLDGFDAGIQPLRDTLPDLLRGLRDVLLWLLAGVSVLFVKNAMAPSRIADALAFAGEGMLLWSVLKLVWVSIRGWSRLLQMPLRPGRRE